MQGKSTLNDQCGNKHTASIKVIHAAPEAVDGEKCTLVCVE